MKKISVVFFLGVFLLSFPVFSTIVKDDWTFKKNVEVIELDESGSVSELTARRKATKKCNEEMKKLKDEGEIILGHRLIIEGDEAEDYFFSVCNIAILQD